MKIIERQFTPQYRQNVTEGALLQGQIKEGGHQSGSHPIQKTEFCNRHASLAVKNIRKQCPEKPSVRFSKISDVHSALYHTISSAFDSTNLEKIQISQH